MRAVAVAVARVAVAVAVGTLALLVGCSGSPSTDTDDTDPFPDLLPPPVFLSGCLMPEGGSWPADTGYYGGASASFSGTVVAVDEADCYAANAHVVGWPPTDETVRVVVEDEGGGRWQLAVAAPDVTLSADDALTVDFAFVPGGFGPDAGHLHLTWADGREAWMGEAGRVQDLTPPDGVALTQGDAVGTDSGECGSWSYYDVAFELPNASGTLPWGGTVTVDGTTLAHGGVEWSEGGTSCPDWFVARAVLGVVR